MKIRIDRDRRSIYYINQIGESWLGFSDVSFEPVVTSRRKVPKSTVVRSLQARKSQFSTGSLVERETVISAPKTCF